MFDFLDSDWFIIALEVVFLFLIIYDIKKYIQTKKKEYVTNAVLTIGFAIWTLYPMYTKYFGWEDSQKNEMLLYCKSQDINVITVCECVNNTTFKTYTFYEYKALDQNEKEYKEFIKETNTDCLDNSWF